MLKVHHLFYSLQGESTYNGLPCLFIRLAGCNLRCAWCDTSEAYENGTEMELSTVISNIRALNPACSLVEVTGGEPLMQKDSPKLIQELLAEGFKVLVETSGSLDISLIPAGAVTIMDIKCPSSLMSDKMDFNNLGKLKAADEVKFVVADKADFLWASGIIKEYSLNEKVTVLISPVHETISLQELTALILESNLNLKLQLQLHKSIWTGSEKEAGQACSKTAFCK